MRTLRRAFPIVSLLSLLAFSDAAALAQTCQPGEVSVTDPGLTSLLQNLLDANAQTAGATMGVSLPRLGTWKGSRGYADLSTQPPISMQPDDLSVIASTSKSFVAALVLQLDQEHVLSLDDPLENWAPGHFDGKGITIRQLLGHTSGVYNYVLDPSFTSGGIQTVAQALELAESKPLDFSPGTKWSYSNTGYLLLGVVIEQATGSPSWAEVRRRFLEPLGLVHTFLDFADVPGGFHVRGYAGSPGNWRDVTFQPSGEAAWTRDWTDGAMVSNTSDLLRWFQALLGGEVLDRNHIEMMITPSPQSLVSYPSLIGRPGGYGFGLEVIRENGGLLYGHGGGCDPFTTFAYRDPARDAGFALLLNGIPAAQVPVDMLSRALDYCDADACVTPDCNHNSVPDACELQSGASPDCDQNGIPDECDIAAASFGFQVRRDTARGTRVDSLASGDLDGDGNIDLVGCDSLANEVHLLLNDGQGNFEGLGSLAVGDAPKAVLLADWNADGKLDLAAMNSNSGDVTVLSSRKDGSLLDRDAAAYAVGDKPTGIVTLDVNRDGSLDLAGINLNAQDFWFRLNQGDGRFGEVRRLTPAQSPSSLTTADLNGDGASDLLLLSRTGGALQAFFAGAGGELVAGEETPLGGNPVGLAFADMDGDKDLDVAVLRLERNTLTILANDGSGKLSAFIDLANGPYTAGRLLAADLDQDGEPDLIVSATEVLVRRNLGGGRFEFPETFSIGPYATQSLLLADLDQNGYSDMAAATPAASAGNGVAVVLSRMSRSIARDCNRNEIPDACDIATGTSGDQNHNGMPDECERRFHRGDPNSSGTTDISDGIDILSFLFLGKPPTFSCQESADVNNDGTIDISDGIYLLSWRFTGGPEPIAPGPTGAPCGVDPDPAGSAGDLGCEIYAPCQ